MRVLVVIVLVLAGIGALFLALGQGDPTPPNGSGAAAPQMAAAPGPAAPSTSDTQMSAVPDTRRETPRTASQPRQVEPNRVAASGSGNVTTGIEGTVTNPDGAPVSDALVQVRDDNAFGGAANLRAFDQFAGINSQEIQSWSVRTDLEGRYMITGISPDDGYTLIVEAEGFATKERPMIRIEPDGLTREDVELDNGFTVHGWVRDITTATLLPDVTMTLVPLTLAQLPEDDPALVAARRQATTNGDGAYSIPNVAPGMYMLSANADGYGSLSMTDVRVGEAKKRMVKREFNLEPGRVIAGIAVDSEGTPLEDVRVTAISHGGQKTSKGSTRSGPDGRFEIRDLIEATYSVVGQLEGYDVGRALRVEAGNTGVRIELIRQGGVEGRVVRPDGSPMTNFTVALRMINPHTGEPGRPIRSEKVRSASDGAFVIDGVPEGAFVVEGQAEDYAPTLSERFEVVKREMTSGVEVRMSRGGSIVGRVIDGNTGEPIRGATVGTNDNNRLQTPLDGIFGMLMPRSTTERSVRTNAEGEYRLERLMPGMYQVQVTHPNYTTIAQNEVSVVDSENPTEVASISLYPGASLTGRVFDSAGDPLRNSQVTLSGNTDAPGLSYQTRTGADGRYQIKNIQPGNYKLHATRPAKGAADPFSAIVEMQQSQVQVVMSEGRELSQDLYLGE